MMDKLPCCLCQNETSRDGTMVIVVHVPKNVTLPKHDSRGMYTNHQDRTMTYNLCGVQCLEVWASVIAAVSDPNNPLARAAAKLTEQELKEALTREAVVNVKKQAGNN